MRGHQRILIFANGIVDFEHMSGGDRIFMRLAKSWGRAGHDVQIYTSPVGARVCRENGLENCHATAELGETRSIWVSYLMRTVKSLDVGQLERPDVIFSSSDYAFDTLPCWLLHERWPSAKWIFALYHIIPHPLSRLGSSLLSNTGSFLSQRLSLRLIGRADRVLTENSFNVDLLARMGIDRARIRLVHSPPEISSETSGEVGIAGERYDACYVGRIHPSKGVFELVQAWELVSKVLPRAKLAVIGGGRPDTVEKFRSYVRNSSAAARIDYVGFVTENEKFRILRHSKLMIFASHEEGIPLVFFEAWASKIPIVAYFLPTYHDFRDALIPVRVGDVWRLASATIKVLKNETDPQSAITSGIRFISASDWETTASGLLRFENAYRAS